jgi:rhodanese-related sulfurtransferase
MWQEDPEDVKILDVRTPEEWVFTGHAPMATNIPFAFMAYVWDEEKQGFSWSLNPDFVELVKERFEQEDTILVSCRSGGRSAMAIDTLTAAGFTNVFNILDGMEGSTVDDPDSVFRGMRLRNGWKASGLPWTYDLDPGRMALPDRATGTLHPGNAED